MTSLALLALPASHAPTFNTAFYSAAATVIPVLFLGLALQSRAYEDLLKTFVDTASFKGPETTLKVINLIGFIALPLIAGFILLYGVVGEIQALTSLFLRRVEGGPVSVLIATAFLTVAVAVSPAVTLARAMARASRILDSGVHGTRGKEQELASEAGHATGRPDPEAETAPGEPASS